MDILWDILWDTLGDDEIFLRDMILDLMRYCNILYIAHSMIDRDV